MFAVMETPTMAQCSGSFNILSQCETNVLNELIVTPLPSSNKCNIRRSKSLPMNLNQIMMESKTNANNNSNDAATATNKKSEESLIKMKSKSTSSSPKNLKTNLKDSSLRSATSTTATTTAKRKPSKQKVVRIQESPTKHVGRSSRTHNTRTTRCTSTTMSVRRLLKFIDAHQWNEVERICEEQPEIMKQVTVGIVQGEKIQSTPLMFACQSSRIPLSTIDALVTAYPSALYRADEKRGLLPIHIACCRDVSLAAIQYLLKAYPQSLYMKDNEGNTPIHFVSSMTTKSGNNASKVLSFLVEQDPTICMIRNMKQKLPLHLICARWETTASKTHRHPHPNGNPSKRQAQTQEILSLPCIQKVIQAYPDAIVNRDSRNRLPIHIACAMTHPRYDLIELLLKECPETVLSHDGTANQKTPLQLVAINKNNHAVGGNDNGDNVVKLINEYTKRETNKRKKNTSSSLLRKFVEITTKNVMKNDAMNSSINNKKKKLTKSKEDLAFDKIKHQYVTVYHR